MNIFNEKKKQHYDINKIQKKKETNQPRATTKCENGIQRKQNKKLEEKIPPNEFGEKENNRRKQTN